MTRKILIIALTMLFSVVCFAEEGQDRNWTDQAELSYVMTGGNVETNTLGFKNLFDYKWEKATLTFKVGGIRAENTNKYYFAVGDSNNFSVISEEETVKTAEMYYANIKYQRNISEKFFWFTGLGWERNRFSGIDNRYNLFAGVGNIWFDSEESKFKTEYGLQYTKEEPVFEPLNYDDSYGSLRFAYTYFRKVFQNSQFDQNLEVVMNMEETSDYRAVLQNSFTTNFSKRLALKVGLDFFYDNEPAFINIPLFDSNNVETGTVLYELDELDTVFTTSLVITF